MGKLHSFKSKKTVPSPDTNGIQPRSSGDKLLPSTWTTTKPDEAVLSTIFQDAMKKVVVEMRNAGFRSDSDRDSFCGALDVRLPLLMSYLAVTKEYVEEGLRRDLHFFAVQFVEATLMDILKFNRTIGIERLPEKQQSGLKAALKLIYGMAPDFEKLAEKAGFPEIKYKSNYKKEVLLKRMEISSNSIKCARITEIFDGLKELEPFFLSQK